MEGVAGIPLMACQTRFSFASCVDSIKEGIRKISGCSKDPPAEQPTRKIDAVGSPHPLEKARQWDGTRRKATVQGGQILGVRRKRRTGVVSRNQMNERKSSFEVYLSTIPKLDPIDRTVGWVYEQTDNVEEVRQDMYGDLPPRGSIIPNLFPAEEGRGREGLRMIESSKVTSVSQCESDRGTHGRGTPPIREEGQPRLDELFRQLQLKQERETKKKLAHVGEHLAAHTLMNVYAHQVPGYPPGITPDLLPFLPSSPAHPAAAIVHKNSSYYNHGLAPGTSKPCPLDYACEWQTCRTRFLTTKELLGHVEEEHLCGLPVLSRWTRQGLLCKWRGCAEGGRMFGARYKLLLHVKSIHCKETVQQKTQHNSNQCTHPHGQPLEGERVPSPHNMQWEADPATQRPALPSSYTTRKRPAVRARRASVRVDKALQSLPQGRTHTDHPGPPLQELAVEAQPMVTQKRTRIHIPPHQFQPDWTHNR